MKLTSRMRLKLLVGALLATSGMGMSVPAKAQEKIVIHGASMFNKDHPFNQTMVRFGQLVKKYYGKPFEIVMHENSELGSDRDYLSFMSRGTSVDIAVVAPGNMSNFSKAAALMDMPFLFRDRSHWHQVVSGNALDPIGSEFEKQADVKVLGYVGGGERNIIAKRKFSNIDELKGFKMRVQGAPVHARIFSALGINPSVIVYTEVYNAIQSGVVDGLENEAVSLEQIKFYEVAPEISLTRHSITVRPLVFSNKTFQKFPPDLQAAIIKAGAEAANFGRTVESAMDTTLLKRLEFEKKLRVHEFKDADKLSEHVIAIQDAYAKEIGAEATLKNIRAIR